MKTSQLVTKVSKTVPSDEQAKNAQLLIKAGFIHKEMAGVYAFLPLGLRVIEKIKQIVREEMDSVGGQELAMTALQPRDLWEKTDRWDDAKVDNWFKTKLANGAELGVGLTHEEPVVDAIAPYINSYKDFPKSVYQIGTKFRNEKRAKSGILRGREFLMKDMYSFARNQEEHDKVYEQVAAAYHKVYRRLGLGDITHRVKADGGIFTDRYSDEFQTITPLGEDKLFKIPATDEYFNQEVAPSQAPALEQDSNALPLQEVETKDIVGIDALAQFLQMPVDRLVKTMLYEAEDGRIIAVAVRGGYTVNDIKLRKVVHAKSLKLADEATVKRITGAEIGYAGLIGLPDDVELVVDDSCQELINFEMGANRTYYHSINVNWGRDLPKPTEFHDIKVAQQGDINPQTGKEYEVVRAVEVGNIFPLETKYTDALDVYFTDENGQRQSIIMGCYGIGISRLMGVIAEVFADERGLVWPESVAPYKVYLTAIGDDEAVQKEVSKLYDILQNAGVEVLYDDSDQRPGEKFATCDSLGIPYRLVVSKKTLATEQYELKKRTEPDAFLVSFDKLKSAFAL